VETLWPKPLPNHWILGSVTGVAVDAQDHIWIVHRGADSLTGRTENGLGTNPPTAENCCLPAPPVLEFDTAGTLLSHWGGPGQGYDWPKTPGGIAVDAKGNVWIAAAGWPEPPGARAGGAGRAGGRGGAAGAAAGEPPAPASPPPPPSHDAHILKFSRTGQFLAQYGKPGTTDGSASKTSFNRPANLDIDAAANEVYVADGYGNKRVVVLDANTGAYKRHWGAYGAAPDDTAPPAYDPAAPAAKQFRAVSCVAVNAGDATIGCAGAGAAARISAAAASASVTRPDSTRTGSAPTMIPFFTASPGPRGAATSIASTRYPSSDWCRGCTSSRRTSSRPACRS
jgi:hypothetical protein